MRVLAISLALLALILTACAQRIEVSLPYGHERVNATPSEDEMRLFAEWNATNTTGDADVPGSLEEAQEEQDRERDE